MDDSRNATSNSDPSRTESSSSDSSRNASRMTPYPTNDPSRKTNTDTPHIPTKEYLEIEDQLWQALEQLTKRLPKGQTHRLPSKYERDSIGFLGFGGLFDG